jgi:hypothetical protein
VLPKLGDGAPDPLKYAEIVGDDEGRLAVPPDRVVGITVGKNAIPLKEFRPRSLIEG